ncbi:tetratricopeptide repeat protein [Poriferisphaera corsica]|uniref:Tetratricopeptide repeat protein n=1 Tax=Poriferisphaera corsica TaxID=2528020 RepID=A0A517YYY6_9BACT|nr:tetratricopeptide repeat protein [Poriferisphaera corsica]QDU35435.1 tetratricopeptide repeat protein [Poriferisphaera corsica]
MSETSSNKTLFAAFAVFIAVIAMCFGTYIFLFDSEEPTPEQIADKQVELADRLDKLQNSFVLAMENQRPAPELIGEIAAYAKENPDSASAQVLDGQAQLYIRNFQAAYDALERALQLDPNQYQTEMLTGTIAYDNLNNLENAVKHFERASQLNKTNPEPLLYLAQIRAQQDMAEEAFDYLNRAIAIDRNLPQAHASLADLYRKRELFDAASREYEIALEQSNNSKLQRQHSIYLFKYAQMLTEQGKPEEALPLIAEMTTSARMQPEVLAQIGEVWNDLGQPDQAALYFAQLVKADPANEAATALASQYYIIAGNAKDAETYMNHLRQINPASPKLQDLATQIADMKSQS